MKRDNTLHFRDHVIFAVMVMGVVSFTILADYALSSVEVDQRVVSSFDQDFIPDHHPSRKLQPPDQVEPGQERLVFDPLVPPTCKLRLSFWFPAGAISAPIQVKAFCTGLPENVPPLAGQIDSLFFFGAWMRGRGGTVERFDPSIVLKVKYDDNNTLFPREDQLRVVMYNPITRAWVKLCSSVDIYENEMAAGLAVSIPIKQGSNPLFGLAIDNTPPLQQVVDSEGNTTLSLERTKARFQVPAGTVENGVHFEITPLVAIAENSSVTLNSPYFDIKACHIDHVIVENSRQLTRLSKPLRIEFDYDAETLTKAGDRAKLTIMTLQNNQWVDLETSGHNIIRDEHTLTVDTNELGVFRLAIR